jgi:hypothetical protein
MMLPQHLYERLRANGAASLDTERDHTPVVKFFDPSGAATWLITELNPGEPDILFGLCDLGQGFPELGTVRFSELAETKNRLGINLERDLFFAGKYPLSVYAEAARHAERITEDDQHLKDAAKRLGLSETPTT